MKSLKISILAIAAIAMLTAIASVETESTKKSTNKDVKQVQIDAIAMTDKKVIRVPTQG